MKYHRTIKLILPEPQLKLIFVFVGISALSLVLQYLLLMSALSRTANELPHDGMLLLDGLGGIVWRILAITAGLILPLTLVVGILATHRFAGPIYRFKIFLKQVIAGEKPADCRLRKGDELQDVCDLINQATAPVRRQASATEAAPAAEPGYRAAS